MSGNTRSIPMLCSLALFFFLTACKDGSKKNDMALKVLTENLTNSNRTINISSQQILKALEEKQSDPYTQERAAIWFPKAQQIHEKSTIIYDYIENLKSLKEEKNTEELYNKLTKYKTDVLAIDSSMEKTFNNIIYSTTQSFDTLQYKNFTRFFFENNSEISNDAILTTFQNNIKNIENKLLAYCLVKVPDNYDGFDSYAAIVGQNSTVLNPGEILEINAGVGAFSRSSNPVININNEKTELNENAFASYKMKAHDKPGKYIVPVKISFFNQTTGKKEVHEVPVEYTVAKACDQ